MNYLTIVWIIAIVIMINCFRWFKEDRSSAWVISFFTIIILGVISSIIPNYGEQFDITKDCKFSYVELDNKFIQIVKHEDDLYYFNWNSIKGNTNPNINNIKNGKIIRYTTNNYFGGILANNVKSEPAPNE